MAAPTTSALMYHDVVTLDNGPSGRQGGGPDRYKIVWAELVAHLDRIAAAVAAPPTLLTGEVRQELDAGSWMLTFDDGGASAVPVGVELRRRGWCGHFFVVTGMLTRRGFVDADAIRELDVLGHVIGSHTVSHPDRMDSLADAELQREWSESVEALSDILGKPVRTGSVPGGYYGANVARAAARAGIRVLFTSLPVRRPRRAAGCLVVGRYSVKAHTSAEDAAAVAAGRPGPWARQYLAWTTRRPAKRLLGSRYGRVRRALISWTTGSTTS